MLILREPQASMRLRRGCRRDTHSRSETEERSTTAAVRRTSRPVAESGICHRSRCFGVVDAAARGRSGFIGYQLGREHAATSQVAGTQRISVLFAIAREQQSHGYIATARHPPDTELGLFGASGSLASCF